MEYNTQLIHVQNLTIEAVFDLLNVAFLHLLAAESICTKKFSLVAKVISLYFPLNKQFQPK